MAVLPAYHLRVFDTKCLRTVYKAHLVYVAAIYLFVESSSVASGKDVARHFRVIISSTKSLVSNLFVRLGFGWRVERRHLSRREILRVNSGGVARCDGAPGPISKHASA